MVRETRHLWVGNLPDGVREDRIRDHFKRYGRVQSVKLVGRASEAAAAGAPGLCAAVAFMDIKSAAKAHHADHALDERSLSTVYYEPRAIPAEDQPNCYSGSSGASSCGTTGAAGTTGGYSASSSSERARTRDRIYRNGPTTYTNSVSDRNSHTKWYNNYATSPTATSENLGIVSTGSTEGTTLGRRRGRSGSSSGSGSTSRSVSSSSGGRSASSSSSRTSSPSGDHRRKHQWPSSGSNNKPLAICVRNLPQRSSDSSLKDGLFHEYKKHGKVSWVKVSGINQDRYAVVCFKKPSDVEKALEVSQDKLFFGCKISVGPYQGMDVEDNESRPYETDLDEFHPKATRTLFIGNLEKDVTPTLLREKFKHFGKIIEIDIKKQSGGTSGYAFCQYANISSVVQAIRNMDGEHVGVSRVKLGFGKSMATSCIWIDGVTDLTEKQVFAQCARIGTVSQVSLCNGSGHALVVFEQVASAQQAVKELRGLNIRGRKLQVDFASRECQDAFYEQLEKQNNNTTLAENRTPTTTADRFTELPMRPFDEKSATKYNRYDSSPRARQVSYSRSRGTRLLSQTSGEHVDGTVPDFSERRFRYEDFSGTPTSDAAIDAAIVSGVITNGPALQSVVVVSSPISGPSVPPPPLVSNMRHLQKERVHLLEQLEECPSSGDELISPKKRLKAERSSLGRRPSGEASSRHHRDVSPCIKRRRGSETSRHHWHTPSPVSRPGTPLHDERPDSPVPTEPRRPILIPRRSVPMCLPLPRFAAQVLPRAVPISPPRPPAGPPPPASPTSRLLSPASSTGSSPSPAEPSLDERIRSLDERYEKWTGSRVTSFSENTERTRFRHHLLDLDVTEVQPSEVMRSVLAKRSVFDEDSKRLESISDKYETPIRTTCAFPSPSAARVSPSPLNSPQSAGRSPFSGSPNICTVKVVPPTAPPPQPTPAKGLQYPFPSHPPVVTTLSVDGTVIPSSLPGEFLEESSRSLSVERLSSSNVDSSNIPRNNSNTPSCSERVPVSVSYNTDSVSIPCVQSSNSQKAAPRSVSSKCEPKTPKTSEYKTSSNNKDNSILNISELDVIGEGDIKTKCGVVNSDNLDRRKNEYTDDGQNKMDFEINVKENRDQSFIQKNNSENPQCDLIKFEEIAISTFNINCDTKLHSDSENWKINKTSDKIIEPSERRKFVKDDVVKLNSEKDSRRTDSDKNKKEEYKDKSNFLDDNNKASSINRLSSVEILDSNCIENLNDRENSGKERLENERREHEQMNREKIEKERIDKERKEKEKIERERLDKDRREKDKLEQVERERIEKELIEKERREKEKVERERREKEKLEKERREKELADRERVHKERQERERLEKEKNEREKPDKHEKSDRLSDTKSDKHEKRREKDTKKRDDKDSVEGNDSFMSYKEKRREKDEHQNESKHRHRESSKKDSHDRSDNKKESSKTHDSKYKDISRKSSRDEISREIVRKDSSDSTASRNSHDSNKSKDHDHQTDNKDDHRNCVKSSKSDHHKSRHHDREPSTKVKEEVDYQNESSRNGNVDKRDRIDSDKIHPPDVVKEKKLSIDDKQRHYSFDSHNDHRSHDLKRKERLNSSCSLPASVGLKRRISSHDNLEHDDSKRPKLNIDKKLPERRDSKDSSKYIDKYRHKTSKNNISKQLEDKIKDDRKNSKELEEKLKNKDKEFTEKEISDTFPAEKDLFDVDCNEENNIKEKEIREHYKSKSIDKIRHKKHSKESDEYKMDTSLFDMDRERDHSIDKEFLERLELRSSLEDEKQQALKKELKERKRLQQLQQIQQLQIQTQQSSFQQQDDKKDKKTEERKKEIKEKRISTERKSREDPITPKIENIRKKPRKLTNSTDSSDSDEPKKHSIFDIVDEGPTYISMYDKVKARSCKNMQKQEEEKRQEKIKAKFSQLKQSRAKREEKKRSNSWDEDSDSDREHKKSTSKSLIASSSEDEYRRRHRENITSDSENDHEKFKLIHSKMIESYDGDSTDDTRNKIISRKNSRSRITSDTSDDDKRDFQNSNYIDYDTKRHLKTLQKENCDDIKPEILDNIYDAKSIKDEMKCNFYENSKSMQTLIDEKKPIIESGIDFIKNEHYIKSEPIFKYDSKYSDTEYDMYSEEPICSDSIKTEIRKKHKKKQKRQKTYTSDDDNFCRYDKSLSENLDIHSKRKHINKKDKKRERSSIDEFDAMKNKMKLKKPKRVLDSSTENRSENNNFKRGEIMQDIFGPLSDDCDDKIHNIYDPVFNKCDTENKEMPPSLDLFNIKEKNHYFNGKVCTSDSDCNIYSKPISNIDVIPKDLFKEDIKKRKDKKRKDRKSIIKEDDNSLDVDAAGKAIEASLCADTIPDTKKSIEKPDLPPPMNTPPLESDVFRFTDGDESRESSMVTIVPHNNIDHAKKENKEKKKKKKKNKEDRQNRKDHHHHHHHHRERSVDKDVKIITDTKIEIDSSPNIEKTDEQPVVECKPALPSPSLPRLIESPPLPTEIPDSPDLEITTPPPPPPSSNKIGETRRISDKFIPGFGAEIDDNISETAVKSISDFDSPIIERQENIIVDNNKSNSNPNVEIQKLDEKIDEKPRAVISQEETEDAVAALLGESFGGRDEEFNDYNENTQSPEPPSNVIPSETNDSIPDEEAEEMRQAVQNLNASELEIKPDTPQSENDLQIDTDTDDDTRIETKTSVIPPTPVIYQPTPIVKEDVPIKKLETPPPKNLPPIEEPVKIITNKELAQPKALEKHEITTPPPTVISKGWSLGAHKPIDQPLIISTSSVPSRDDKSVHLTPILLKPISQTISQCRPLLTTTTKVTGSYQVINPIPRPTTIYNAQPPTIKIPEQHVIYHQRQPSIMISPRMAGDIRLHSPKSHQHMEIQTKGPNMTILTTGPPTLGSPPGLTNIQQRSPGQITLVRMQQPPLSPIQTSQLSAHQSRSMLSPGHHNTVVIQNQSSPVQMNRLPITPVLTPITKQLHPGTINVHQPKAGNTIIQAPKILNPNEVHKTGGKFIQESVLTNTKLILSPPVIVSSQNSTVMVQNRLLSVSAPNQNTQGPILVTPHLLNKAGLNIATLPPEKHETIINGPMEPKGAIVNNQNYNQTSHLHVNHVPSGHIIQTVVNKITELPNVTKPISTIQNVSQQNVVQRVITPVVIPNVIQVEHRNENITPVISSTITKPQTIITNTQPIPNVIEKPATLQVITPIRPFDPRTLKTPETEESANKVIKSVQSADKDNATESVPTIIIPSAIVDKPKCETDFEELLKQTAIVNKIEKPPHMVPNNNLINIPNDVITLEKKEIKTEIIRPNETSVISNKENNKHVSNIDNKTIINPKEDCDFWSANEINIESVIKKVDALCGASDLSITNDNEIKNGCLDNQKPLEIKISEKINNSIDINPKPMQDLTEELLDKLDNKINAKRGGGRSRGRKIQDRVAERVQTRLGNKLRGTTTTLSKRGRGRLKVEKSRTSPTTHIPGDVYDFHEDSGDEVNTTPQSKADHRPRLILTIKSPLVGNIVPNLTPVVLPQPPKETNTPGKTLPSSPVQSMTKDDKIEDFVSPSTNTRKSRRLQEKDVPKNTVDDVIEDVIKNASLQGRSGVINKDSGPIRRSARQNLAKLAVNEKPNSDVRKSPRSVKKSKDRRISETSVDSGDEKSSNKDISESSDVTKLENKPNETDQISEPVSESGEVLETPKKIHTETSVKSPTESSPIAEKIIPETSPSSIDEERKTTPLPTSEADKEIIKIPTIEVPNALLKVTPKIDESIIKPKLMNIKTSEELMIDPVSGELVLLRHSDDGNFVPVPSTLTSDANVITRLSTITTTNSRIIPDPKTYAAPGIIKQQSCITVTPTVLTSASDTSAPTSVLKSLTPTIQVASSRVPANVPPPTTTTPIAELKIINPNPSGLLTTVSANNTYLPNAPSIPTGSINVISRPSVQIPLNHAVLGKTQVISSTPIAVTLAGVNTIVGKPLPQTTNIQQIIKPPTGTTPHATPLIKPTIAEPVMTRMQPNIPNKLQPGLKNISLHIAHPPQKQVQAMQMGGQAGGMGPGPVGPSLPRGAQGQHASPPLMAKHMAIIGPQPVITGASSSRINLTAVPSISPQGQMPLQHTDLLGSRSPPPAHQQTSPVTPGEGVYSHFGHQHYQQYLRPHQEARTTPSPYTARSPHGAEGSEAPSPPLELRRPPGARVPHPTHSPSLSDRSTDSPQVAQIYSLNRPPTQAYVDKPNTIAEPPNGGRYYESPAPPPAHVPRVHHPCVPPPVHHRIHIEASGPAMPKMSITQGPGLGVNIGGSVGEERGPSRGSAPVQGGGGQIHITPGPPHASHAPREADSLMMLLNRYPVMWQGLLALKNDAAAVQMHFVHGNPAVAGQTLPCNGDGSTPPLRIAQRMRLEPVQLEAVARKMQMENEHCMLLALPCGRDHLDVLQQSTKLNGGFITYLQRKLAAGIVNIAPPGHNQAAYTVHIFPSCEFANENLERIAPDLLHRVADIAHLLIVIATV